MANEIQITHDDAAETVYAIVRNQAGQFYAGAAAETFEAANWATYAIALAVVDTTSPPATGNVALKGTFPAVAAGHYWLDMFIRAGAAAAQTDYRLAMLQAYWNGAALTASIDGVSTKVDAVQAKTNTIGSGRISYASPVGEAALATIWAGDDYAAADGTAFALTVEDYAGPSLATATAVLRIMDSEQYLSEDPAEPRAADLEVPATIAIAITPSGVSVTLTADLTAAETAAFDTSPPATARNYIYEFVCTLANTRVGYRTHGQMTVRKGIE